MKIKELCKIAHRTAREKGFWGDVCLCGNTKAVNTLCIKCSKPKHNRKRNQGEIIALMHSELSEALEALRSNDKIKNNVSEELADCCIRLFVYCEAYEIDLEKAIVDKMEINANRQFRHGKKF